MEKAFIGRPEIKDLHEGDRESSNNFHETDTAISLKHTQTHMY